MMEKHRFSTASYAVYVNGVCVAKTTKPEAHKRRLAEKKAGNAAFVAMDSTCKIGDFWPTAQ